jgi:DNA-binding response OmpR family regulator
MKILLVEDDERIAEPLAEDLTDQHYVVDVASDGEAAWELVKVFAYDLLVLDGMLPKLSGISLCKRLRSCGYSMPIILLTARDTTEDKLRGLDAGADGYVVKPFNLQELATQIRDLLRRRSSTSPLVLK